MQGENEWLLSFEFQKLTLEITPKARKKLEKLRGRSWWVRAGSWPWRDHTGRRGVDFCSILRKPSMADPRGLHGLGNTLRMVQSPRARRGWVAGPWGLPSVCSRSTAQGPASWHCAHLCSWGQPPLTFQDTQVPKHRAHWRLSREKGPAPAHLPKLGWDWTEPACDPSGAGSVDTPLDRMTMTERGEGWGQHSREPPAGRHGGRFSPEKGEPVLHSHQLSPLLWSWAMPRATGQHLWAVPSLKNTAIMG